MPESLTVRLNSLEDTRRLAAAMAKALPCPFTMALQGTLGAGKTQFVRFFATDLGASAEGVSSPTYVLMQPYSGRLPIYHIDFYRLDSEAQAWDLGIDELFEQDAMVLIEWADKFPMCLPEEHITVRLEAPSEQQRVAIISAAGRTLTQQLQSIDLTAIGN